MVKYTLNIEYTITLSSYLVKVSLGVHSFFRLLLTLDYIDLVEGVPFMSILLVKKLFTVAIAKRNELFSAYFIRSLNSYLY